MLIPGKAGSTTPTWVSASFAASSWPLRRPSFFGLRRFCERDVLKEIGQALGVVQRLPKTCRLVSACKSGDLFLQCHFLDGGDEIQRCLRRRLTPTKPRHAPDHSVIPKCGGFARRTLGMRPQAAVTQSSDHTREIQQGEQECRDPEYPTQPSHRQMDHVIVRAPCRSQQGAMLPCNPPASLIKETPALVSTTLPQSPLVAAAPSHSPSPPKR